MNVFAEFVTSAAVGWAIPHRLPEVALVGRSNVGKSSLINALVRRQIARTSATPGKTRLVNVYRVVRDGGLPFHLVDLPGYGYARGGSEGFDELVRDYFGESTPRRSSGVSSERMWSAVEERRPSALLLVDARHPGLDSDRAAWHWLQRVVDRPAVVATKIDKLARGQRSRAMSVLNSVFEDAVVPVSSVTGEGMDQLWKLIDNLVNRPRTRHPSPQRATARPDLQTRPLPDRQTRPSSRTPTRRSLRVTPGPCAS